MYISPNLSIFQNFDDLKKEKTYGNYKWYYDNERFEVKDVFFHDRFIILGEPGFGKTELLKKIIETANILNYNSIYIDLKNLDLTTSIVDNIARLANRPDCIKTSQFSFGNNENVIVCLDALDEVTSVNLSNVIDRIKDFMVGLEKVKIYISCRRLYFESYQNCFLGYKFKFLLIECFIQGQIVKYLKENNLNDEIVNIVLKNFMQNSGSISVIQTPRYLSLLAKYIIENGVKDIKQLTRCQLFEYFVYNKLNKEKNVLKSTDVDLIKGVLETLALVMTIYQTRKITKDELMTFFKDVQNDLKVNILSKITIDEFLEKSILKRNIDEIEFDNSEFQEYLSAKELSTFPKLQQSLFDLAVNPNIREVYPTWFNVLSYLLELNIGLLNDVLSFGMIEKKTIVEGYFKLITSVNSNLVPEEVRFRVFKEVFEYYQTNKLSLHGVFCQNLSYYFTNQCNDILKKYLNKSDSKYSEFILVRNVFSVVYEIIERQFLDDKEIKYWNNIFLEILENKSTELELKNQILFVSKYLNDKRLLLLMQKMPYKNNKDLLQSIISYTAGIDANSKEMVIFIIDGIRMDVGIATYYITMVTSKSSIIAFFKKINSDIALVDKFHDLAGIEKGKYFHKFSDNLRKIIDDELYELLKDFIFKSYNSVVHLRQQSNVIKSITEVVSEYRNNLIFELIDMFSSAVGKYYEFQLPELFSYCISRNQIGKFIDETKIKLPKPKRLAFETLHRLKYSKEVKYIELFNEGKKYFEADYAEANQNSLNYKNREEEDKREEYKNFSSILNVSNEKKFYPNIFSFYAASHEVVEQYMTEKEVEKLKELNLHFLNIYNPISSKLVFEADGKITVSSFIIDYGEAIQSAKLLNINIENCRQHIINFIPFAYNYHLESIFHLVGSISSSELEEVIRVYREKSDDLWRFMPENLLKLIEKFNIKEAEILLEDFIHTNVFRSSSNSYRTKALRLLNQIKNDENYLELIFNKCISIESDKSIALEANSLLITVYENPHAINWRIDEIYKRVFPFTKNNNGYISSDESEIRDKTFASPLLEVTDEKYFNIYLKLFIESFRIQKQGNRYWSYSQYMRDIALAYFFNLRKYKKFEHFEKVETECRKHENVEHYGYILSTVGILKNQYIDYIGKPTNISECINVYNKIKNNQYIQIYNSKELLERINYLIKTDLNIWIQGEGIKILEAVKSKKRPNETELQKIIKMQFENILLRNGFRAEEINIYREVQALNDKRPDYILAYGFVTPIVIELKLSDHDDLNMRALSDGDSYKNLIFYLQNFNVGYAIFLVYDNQNLSCDKWTQLTKKIELEYSKIPNVVVSGLPQIVT